MRIVTVYVETLFEGADNVFHVFDHLEKEKAITEEQDD